MEPFHGGGFTLLQHSALLGGGVGSQTTSDCAMSSALSEADERYRSLKVKYKSMKKLHTCTLRALVESNQQLHREGDRLKSALKQTLNWKADLLAEQEFELAGHQQRSGKNKRSPLNPPGNLPRASRSSGEPKVAEALARGRFHLVGNKERRGPNAVGPDGRELRRGNLLDENFAEEVRQKRQPRGGDTRRGAGEKLDEGGTKRPVDVGGTKRRVHHTTAVPEHAGRGPLPRTTDVSVFSQLRSSPEVEDGVSVFSQLRSSSEVEDGSAGLASDGGGPPEGGRGPLGDSSSTSSSSEEPGFASANSSVLTYSRSDIAGSEVRPRTEEEPNDRAESEDEPPEVGRTNTLKILEKHEQSSSSPAGAPGLVFWKNSDGAPEGGGAPGGGALSAAPGEHSLPERGPPAPPRPPEEPEPILVAARKGKTPVPSPKRILDDVLCFTLPAAPSPPPRPPRDPGSEGSRGGRGATPSSTERQLAAMSPIMAVSPNYSRATIGDGDMAAGAEDGELLDQQQSCSLHGALTRSFASGTFRSFAFHSQGSFASAEASPIRESSRPDPAGESSSSRSGAPADCGVSGEEDLMGTALEAGTENLFRTVCSVDQEVLQQDEETSGSVISSSVEQLGTMRSYRVLDRIQDPECTTATAPFAPESEEPRTDVQLAWAELITRPLLKEELDLSPGVVLPADPRTMRTIGPLRTAGVASSSGADPHGVGGGAPPTPWGSGARGAPDHPPGSIGGAARLVARHEDRPALSKTSSDSHSVVSDSVFVGDGGERKVDGGVVVGCAPIVGKSRCDAAPVSTTPGGVVLTGAGGAALQQHGTTSSSSSSYRAKRHKQLDDIISAKTQKKPPRQQRGIARVVTQDLVRQFGGRQPAGHEDIPARFDVPSRVEDGPVVVPTAGYEESGGYETTGPLGGRRGGRSDGDHQHGSLNALGGGGTPSASSTAPPSASGGYTYDRIPAEYAAATPSFEAHTTERSGNNPYLINRAAVRRRGGHAEPAVFSSEGGGGGRTGGNEENFEEVLAPGGEREVVEGGGNDNVGVPDDVLSGNMRLRDFEIQRPGSLLQKTDDLEGFSASHRDDVLNFLGREGTSSKGPREEDHSAAPNGNKRRTCHYAASSREHPPLNFGQGEASTTSEGSTLPDNLYPEAPVEQGQAGVCGGSNSSCQMSSSLEGVVPPAPAVRHSTRSARPSFLPSRSEKVPSKRDLEQQSLRAFLATLPAKPSPAGHKRTVSSSSAGAADFGNKSVLPICAAPAVSDRRPDIYYTEGTSTAGEDEHYVFTGEEREHDPLAKNKIVKSGATHDLHRAVSPPEEIGEDMLLSGGFLRDIPENEQINTFGDVEGGVPIWVPGSSLQALQELEEVQGCEGGDEVKSS